METNAKIVKVIKPSTKRDIKIKCPACGHSNWVTVPIDAPAQYGDITCATCGAKLYYEE